MAMAYPMNFGEISNGGCIDLVCTIKVFDDMHGAHLLTGRDGTDFIFVGCLNSGFHSFSILNGTLKQQYPIPIVVSTKHTRVLEFHHPSWDSIKSVVDLCAGFGGLAQGATAAGFEVQVAIDHNQRILDLHSKASHAHTPFAVTLVTKM